MYLVRILSSASMRFENMWIVKKSKGTNMCYKLFSRVHMARLLVYFASLCVILRLCFQTYFLRKVMKIATVYMCLCVCVVLFCVVRACVFMQGLCCGVSHTLVDFVDRRKPMLARVCVCVCVCVFCVVCVCVIGSLASVVCVLSVACVMSVSKNWPLKICEGPIT